MSRATLEILVTLLSSFSLPLSFDERITLSYFQQPRRFTFTRNPETLSRQFSLSLFSFLSVSLCVSCTMSVFVSPPLFLSCDEISLRTFIHRPFQRVDKGRRNSLKETHNLAKEGIEKERERDTKLERRGSWNLLEPSKRTKD